jgi:hypothetical protein
VRANEEPWNPSKHSLKFEKTHNIFHCIAQSKHSVRFTYFHLNRRGNIWQWNNGRIQLQTRRHALSSSLQKWYTRNLLRRGFRWNLNFVISLCETVRYCMLFIDSFHISKVPYPEITYNMKIFGRLFNK